MRVRIICYEDLDLWILGKFALKMQDNLKKLGVDVDIAKIPDKNADINHHIIYTYYNGVISRNDTVMITHVDNIDKLNMLKQQINAVKLGICMSKETQNYLIQMGIEKDKLCYVNPAHDGIISIKKYVIGIASKVHLDGRKNELYFNQLAEELNPKYFKFKIMGQGWKPQIENLRTKGFQIDYIDHFEYKEYVDNFFINLDYYLYMSMDEGQMGFIDAVAAGVKTIVTAQGYHLDAKNAITHPFTTYDELKGILLSLQNEKETLVQSVETWNWYDYSKKHLELWEHILDNKKNSSDFTDGLNSLLKAQNSKIEIDEKFIQNQTEELTKNLKLQNECYKNHMKNKTKTVFSSFKTLIKVFKKITLIRH